MFKFEQIAVFVVNGQ